MKDSVAKHYSGAELQGKIINLENGKQTLRASNQISRAVASALVSQHGLTLGDEKPV